jgi:hypothetical protein
MRPRPGQEHDQHDHDQRAERKVGMSMKAEAVFGAAFVVALAFLAYCIFILPPKTLHVAGLETGVDVASTLRLQPMPE